MGTAGEKTTLVIAQQPEPDVTNVDPLEMQARWNTFQHVPFEESGYSHLTLPFLFTSKDGTGKKEEAWAFSFLISNALDWGNGCYCARHAYFCFKRSQKEMFKLTRKYTPEIISLLATNWTASIVVGGKLISQKEGYSGSLMIFDDAGNVIHERKYEKPVGYFELLGAMSVDALKFAGHRPSIQLTEHLKTKRCKDHQSIIDLGRAAFAEERSSYEFGQYKKILQRDPGFSEVRYWYANQHAWHTGKWDNYGPQKLKALRSYLIKTPLTDTPVPSPGNALRFQEYVGWVDQAEGLLGRGSPIVLARRFDIAQMEKNLTGDLIRQSLLVAGKYPNNFSLPYDLSFVADSIGDCDLSASLLLAIIKSRYNPGSHKTTRQIAERAAKNMMMLGYSRDAIMPLALAINLVEQGDVQNMESYSEELAKALWDVGAFEGSLEMSVLAASLAEDAGKEIHFARAGIAAILSNHRDLLPELLSEAGAKLKFGDVNASKDITAGEAFVVYDLISQGRIKEAQEKTKNRHKVKVSRFKGFAEVKQLALLAQIELDLAAGTTSRRPELVKILSLYPHLRSLWIMFDAYDRREPRVDSGLFYETLAWLHGDDPWVKQVVSDWRKRGGKKPVISSRILMRNVVDYPVTQWPQLERPPAKLRVVNPFEYILADTLTIDSYEAYETKTKGNRTFWGAPPFAYSLGIKDLIDSNDYRTAERICLRCISAATIYNMLELRAHFFRLYHLIDRAKTVNPKV
jgi:hypothetical protein